MEPIEVICEMSMDSLQAKDVHNDAIIIGCTCPLAVLDGCVSSVTMTRTWLVAEVLLRMTQD